VLAGGGLALGGLSAVLFLTKPAVNVSLSFDGRFFTVSFAL